MNRISIKAVLLAAIAQYGLDLVIGTTLLVVFGRGILTSDMTQEELRAATDVIVASGRYLFVSVVFGTATTVAGGYLAARLAKTFPYYNGLAIGIVGTVFGMFFWGESPVWLSVLALLITVPASILGAHLAKLHMAAAQADA